MISNDWYGNCARRHFINHGENPIDELVCTPHKVEHDYCVGSSYSRLGLMNNRDTTPRYAETLAAWAATARIGADARAEARRCFLDTLACMIAGAREPAMVMVVQAMREAGADGPCTHVAGGASLSAQAAALVNGTAAHMLDWDDYEIPGSTHPSPPIIPALLAVSDLRQVTLDDVTTAYVVGFEAIVRAGRALGGYDHYLRGWHATGTIGVLGAAAAVAHLIGLDEIRMARSISFAMSMAAGLKAQIGTDGKPLHAGLAARAGLEAALLAEAGLTSNTGAAEEADGFLALYGSGLRQPESEPAKPGILADGVFRKPWPCCAYTHRVIEAGLELRARPDVDILQICDGVIRTPDPFFRVSPFLRPELPTEARFSMTHTLAWSLIEGDPTPAAFQPAAISRGDIRDLVSMLSVEPYDLAPGLSDMSPEAPDTVMLTLTDGRTINATVAEVKGGTNKQMTDADLRAKLELAGGNPAIIDLIIAGDGSRIFRFAHVVETMM